MPLSLVTNNQLQQAEQDKLREAQVAEEQQKPVIQGIAGYLRDSWNAAYQAKQPLELKMLEALRQREGEYEADKLQQIMEQGGSTVYVQLTQTKCKAAEAWLADVLLDSGSPPWDLKSTPNPNLSDEDMEEIRAMFGERVQQETNALGEMLDQEALLQIKEMVIQDYHMKIKQIADNRVKRMKRKISDQFEEGGWEEAFTAFIIDLTTFPAAFIKGPIIRRKKKLSWGMNQLGQTEAITEEVIEPDFERVSPFDIYPEPGITNIDDGFMFQHHELSASELSELIGVPGYNDEAIRQVLKSGARSSWYVRPYRHEQDEAEKKYHSYYSPTDIYDALEFWGKISGKMLMEWGLESPEIMQEPERHYDCTAWLVGDYVIKAVLNYDPLGEKPYCKTSFLKTPGAFWGRGIPEIIEDVQDICNAAARALVNNMSIASGPQVEINIERLPPGEAIEKVHPWKIWQVTNDPLGGSRKAIEFTQPVSNAKELLEVHDYWSKIADDHSGVPSYLSGDIDVQGAGRTASGLSLLMGAAGKGLRKVVAAIDNDVLKKVVYRQFIFNMRYDEDETIKGDTQVVPKGAVNLALQESIFIRQQEFLTATANEYDMQIMGAEGRAVALRSVAKRLMLPADKIVPSREERALAARKQSLLPSPTGEGDSPAPQNLDVSGNPQGGQIAKTV